MWKYQVLFVLSIVLIQTTAQDYCAVCSDHTMCKYKGIGDCAQRIETSISSSDQTIIVDTHNSLRNKVASGRETQGSNGAQPSATNMKKMSWDAELARIAQRWADQCIWGHDSCRDVKRFGVGQNAYLTMSSSNDDNKTEWAKAVQSWYSEVSKFDRDRIKPFKFSSATGHYTQVVWADSYKIGCGISRYFQDGWYRKEYVCNYGPAGNVRDGVMYETGQPGSSCSRRDVVFQALCA